MTLIEFFNAHLYFLSIILVVILIFAYEIVLTLKNGSIALAQAEAEKRDERKSKQNIPPFISGATPPLPSFIIDEDGGLGIGFKEAEHTVNGTVIHSNEEIKK